MGLAGGRAFFCFVLLLLFLFGGGEEGGGEGTETDSERVAFKICCFSTVLQVTAVEVRPTC